MKKFFLSILFFISFGILSFAETALVVDYLSAKDAEYALSIIGRIEIKDEVFRLISTDGEELASCDLYSVRKLTFGEVGSTATDNQLANQLLVYPNPTQDQLFINGLNANESVRIYDFKGQLLSVTTANADGICQISVSSLPQGTYLLQVGVEIVKFIKQ
jgi:hypothetical protein